LFRPPNVSQYGKVVSVLNTLSYVISRYSNSTSNSPLSFGTSNEIEFDGWSLPLRALLSQAPALQIDSTNRQEILDWCASVLSGPSSLPPELNKVEFRGATAVKVADHKAVLLKMKNEQRASLLIVDAHLTQESGFKSMHEKSGSASLWSDGRRTYVLLYEGSAQEMHAYMVQMGIEA
jgi:hypothetical protein